MEILDRFSSHLKDVLARSIQLATDIRNPEVEPIHLFFVLLNQKGSVATEILTRFKIDQKSAEQMILKLPITGAKKPQGGKGAAQAEITPFSAAAKGVLEKSMLIAHENRHNYIGTEHLLAAIIHIGNETIEEVLNRNKIQLADLDKQLQTVLSNASQFPQITEVAEAVDRIQETLGENMQEPEPPVAKKGGRKKETALDFFAVNLTGPEAQKNIDPVIGRDNEIERTIQILCRRTKNNPVLLGDPGVGKTAIVEGLAKKIAEGDVPDILLNKKVYALDMGLLIAGTIYRGEFEARLRQVIEEVAQDANVILFIDEIHNIVGAGSNQGTMDASNILKPALARGQIRCIGATTTAEFKKYIESDAALERRFQPIYVKEPSLEDTIKILRGIKKNYELFHRVEITDKALEAAARLSSRYISNKFLPDKAIDLLDETAAAKRIKAKSSLQENKVVRLKQKLEKVILAKEKAALNDKFKEAVIFKEEAGKLKNQIKQLERQAAEKKPRIVGIVDQEDVAEQVAKITGTPPSEILLNDKDRLLSLENEIKKHIVGQDRAVSEVSKIIRQAQMELSNPERPLASFLFVGESGVGKTELAKTLAKLLYPNQPDALVKLDMSEFNESFGVSKLLGSPAGYVGYKENNQFTDKVKMNPYCVVLFDEVDKAHRDVTKLLLQILENGEISDATGKKISFKHAIIILTTSLGAEDLKRGVLGFGGAEGGTVADDSGIIKQITEKLKDHFSPELINRLDKICLFKKLAPADLVKIAEMEIGHLNQRLENYKTSVTADTETISKLIASLPDKTAGARDIRRYVRGQIEELMSEIIMKEKVKAKYLLELSGEGLKVK